MFLARYFPGLGLTLERVATMTPEQTNGLRTIGAKMLRAEALERLEHTKAIARAAAG